MSCPPTSLHYVVSLFFGWKLHLLQRRDMLRDDISGVLCLTLVLQGRTRPPPRSSLECDCAAVLTQPCPRYLLPVLSITSGFKAVATGTHCHGFFPEANCGPFTTVWELEVGSSAAGLQELLDASSPELSNSITKGMCVCMYVSTSTASLSQCTLCQHLAPPRLCQGVPRCPGCCGCRKCGSSGC